MKYRKPKPVHIDLSQLRAVPGYPGYYASRGGVVYILRELTFRVDDDGYQRVAAVRDDGEVRMLGPHQAVCRAFNGPPPDDSSQVRHLDENKFNNHPENLRWGTAKENADDMRRHRIARGEKPSHLAKLRISDVREIKKRLRRGEKAKTIAALYEVHENTIFEIKREATWKDIK